MKPKGSKMNRKHKMFQAVTDARQYKTEPYVFKWKSAMHPCEGQTIKSRDEEVGVVVMPRAFNSTVVFDQGETAVIISFTSGNTAGHWTISTQSPDDVKALRIVGHYDSFYAFKPAVIKIINKWFHPDAATLQWMFNFINHA